MANCEYVVVRSKTNQQACNSPALVYVVTSLGSIKLSLCLDHWNKLNRENPKWEFEEQK